MATKIRMNAHVEVPTPPKRTDTVLEGHSVKEATEEAHERESRVESATRRQEVEQRTAELPPDDGKWGSWQAKAGE
jgi:hypothetical protein